MLCLQSYRQLGGHVCSIGIMSLLYAYSIIMVLLPQVLMFQQLQMYSSNHSYKLFIIGYSMVHVNIIVIVCMFMLIISYHVQFVIVHDVGYYIHVLSNIRISIITVVVYVINQCGSSVIGITLSLWYVTGLHLRVLWRYGLWLLWISVNSLSLWRYIHSHRALSSYVLLVYLLYSYQFKYCIGSYLIHQSRHTLGTSLVLVTQVQCSSLITVYLMLLQLYSYKLCFCDHSYHLYTMINTKLLVTRYLSLECLVSLDVQQYICGLPLTIHNYNDIYYSRDR